MIAESRIAHDLLLWNTAVVAIRIAGKQVLWNRREKIFGQQIQNPHPVRNQYRVGLRGRMDLD
jgi:hypothetical protein